MPGISIRGWGISVSRSEENYVSVVSDDLADWHQAAVRWCVEVNSREHSETCAIDVSPG